MRIFTSIEQTSRVKSLLLQRTKFLFGGGDRLTYPVLGESAQKEFWGEVHEKLVLQA